MINYLSLGNTKVSKMSGVKTYSWGIPAFRSRDGFVTCPGAGMCAKGCYAQQGFYLYPHVYKVYERRLAISQSRDFHHIMTAEIERRKVQRIRVHDSGDFYDLEYASKWQVIAKTNPQTVFYSYTKNLPLVQQMWWPPNWFMIYSEGGKFDHLIDYEKHRHSRVFLNLKDLLAAGYADASVDDSVAIGSNLKVGLIYHGRWASRAFTSAPGQQVPTCAPGTTGF